MRERVDRRGRRRERERQKGGEGDRLDPISMGVKGEIKRKSKHRMSVINSSMQCRWSYGKTVLERAREQGSLLFFHFLLPPLEPLIPYFPPPSFLASLHGPGLFSSRTIGEVRSWSLTRARRYRPDEQPRRLRRHLCRADAPPTRAGFTNRFQIFQHNEADYYPKIPPHAYTLFFLKRAVHRLFTNISIVVFRAADKGMCDFLTNATNRKTNLIYRITSKRLTRLLIKCQYLFHAVFNPSLNW